jgi:thioesterase domain-containing protein/acyl carrier protein
MEITFQPFDEIGRARIAQLINKSNQFNLTTKRYTEAQIASMQDDPAYFTLQVRLSDTFGDNGMIAAVICRRATAEQWEIDTWLMSCRVLGRRVENMTLLAVLDQAKKEGVRKLIGTYIPTDRNKLVQEHYPKLGFQLVKIENQVSTYELEVDTAVVERAPMSVRHIGPTRVSTTRRSSDFVIHLAEETLQGTSVRPQQTSQIGSVDEIESKLIRIWEEILDRENVGTRDDFFELGGDSLLGIRLMIEIEKQFGRRFEISKLVSHPTIEALARELGASENSSPVPGVNEVESELTRIWEEILDRENVGVRDDFFELGGDSLLGIRLMIEIEKHFGRRFEISQLVARPTIEALAQELGASKSEVQANHIVPMRPRGDRTPLFFIHCGTGHVLRYRALTSFLDSDIPIYGVRAPDLRAMTSVPTVEELAVLYLADIRKTQPQGPYQLAGFCFGGTVAYEVARRLTEMGETVSLVVLIQAVNASYYRNLPLMQSVRYRFKYAYDKSSKYGGRLVRGEWGEFYQGIRDIISWRKRKKQSSSSRSEPELGKNGDSQDIYDNIALLATLGDTFAPKPYLGRIHLIRADTQGAELENDMTFGWQAVARGGVEVCTLPGNHYTLLEKPNVAKVAEKVGSWLAKREVSV